ncbi:MAG: hypothetical protein L6408_09765 [Nanoarchaeota archaeon]|nr:hypothetical protein [Nanoarchaeota archaeon]
MIQFLADNIDQMDLALDQLAVKNRNFNRFALMLIDNVVELTLHRHARDKASENEMWSQLGKPKHDPNAVLKALGQYFGNKVKFAAKLGLIDNIKCESILNLHSFRNTAYHKGLRHEGILHSIALFYFVNACELLKCYSPMWWSWGSNDKLSHRARKYIGNPSFTNHEEVFNAAYQRLLDVADSMEEDLVGDLHSDMSATISSIDDAIQFLTNESPEERTRDQVIIYCQALSFAFTDEAKAFARQNSCPKTSVGQYVDWIVANYGWHVKSDPIPGWKRRLASLEKEKDYHKALKCYCDFMRQTEEIRSKINESAAQLDAYIQQQIDIARGK